MRILEIANRYASLFSVIITLVYAWLTFQTVKLMRRQVTADIRVAKIHLRINAEGRKNGFKISALEDLAKRPYSSLRDLTFTFRMFVDFVNVSSGSGAIDQPKLLIKFRSSKYELLVRPTSERIGAGRRTIFIAGNGFEKIDLDYFVAFDEEFLESLKKFSAEIEYYICYRDNSGRRHRVMIHEVEGLK
jgi:hypothetical protein